MFGKAMDSLSGRGRHLGVDAECADRPDVSGGSSAGPRLARPVEMPKERSCSDLVSRPPLSSALAARSRGPWNSLTPGGRGEVAVSGDGTRVAVVTGASQGIGAGLVAGYRAQGWAVVANSRHIEP